MPLRQGGTDGAAQEEERIRDVLVIGSGAGGLATAITARKHGFSVIVDEKEPVYGGTTAFSGGAVDTGKPPRQDEQPGRQRAKPRDGYMKAETGNWFDEGGGRPSRAGPSMLDWFEKETAVRFVPTLYPDYHPTVDGGVDVGRSVLAAPFDIERARR